MKYYIKKVAEPPVYSELTDWKPKKWAVFGASGFVGKNIVRELTQAGIEVVAISAPRMSLLNEQPTTQSVIEAAQTSSVVHDLAMKVKGVDVIVNAAGLAKPDSGDFNALLGANALLPTVLAMASAEAGVGRLIQLSSAAVQGEKETLDDTAEVAPFSPYSFSKALGELSLIELIHSNLACRVLIVRATSVQGIGRKTTESLKKFSKSCLASVAFPANQPTVVSSVTSLSCFVRMVGTFSGAMSPIQLQPWEGLTTLQVLELAGGKRPLILPNRVCKSLVWGGKWIGAVFPRIAGPVRRAEVTWFGQHQESFGVRVPFSSNPTLIRQILQES